MHELGILKQIAHTVDKVAATNSIKLIKSITLEVGNESGIVPYYMKKMFPIVTDVFPILKNTDLVINLVCGKSLIIKEIGY